MTGFRFRFGENAAEGAALGTFLHRPRRDGLFMTIPFIAPQFQDGQSFSVVRSEADVKEPVGLAWDLGLREELAPDALT